MVWAMTIPLRSWLLGSVGAALGCGLFVFDSFIERLGPSAHNLQGTSIQIPKLHQ
jgi:hypothetical protein